MEILIGFGSALWLGILTSISPCPLASNVAAISFLSKKITHPLLVLLSGIAYTFGRMLTYAILGFILINSVLSVPQVAQFLQKYMTRAIGPVLVVTGLILLDIIKLNFAGLSLSRKHHNKLAEAGVPGAFLLGAVFALAFCPVSAALFFGSLIPLALNHKFGLTLPFIYGIGTGLPVLALSITIAMGVASISVWFRRMTAIEYYMRILTGIIFILAGIYYFTVYFLKFA